MSEPSLPHLCLITQLTHRWAQASINPQPSAGLLHLPWRPKWEGFLYLFISAELQIPHIWLKTGNTTDAKVDREEQENADEVHLPRAPCCVHIPANWPCPPSKVLSHVNPAGCSKPFWPNPELNQNGSNTGQIRTELKNVTVHLPTYTGERTQQLMMYHSIMQEGKPWKKNFKWNSEVLWNCSFCSHTVWIVAKPDLAVWKGIKY